MIKLWHRPYNWQGIAMMLLMMTGFPLALFNAFFPLTLLVSAWLLNVAGVFWVIGEYVDKRYYQPWSYDYGLGPIIKSRKRRDLAAFKNGSESKMADWFTKEIYDKLYSKIPSISIAKFIERKVKEWHGYRAIEIDPQGFGYEGVPIFQMKRMDYIEAKAIYMPVQLGNIGVKSQHMHPDRKEIIWGKDNMFNMLRLRMEWIWAHE